MWIEIYLVLFKIVAEIQILHYFQVQTSICNCPEKPFKQSEKLREIENILSCPELTRFAIIRTAQKVVQQNNATFPRHQREEEPLEIQKQVAQRATIAHLTASHQNILNSSKVKYVLNWSRAATFSVHGWIRPNFNHIRNYIIVLVTCKNEEDPIKNEGAIVLTRL